MVEGKSADQVGMVKPDEVYVQLTTRLPSVPGRNRY